MFDVGGGELILILLAIIVLFGPKKIPEIAQMFGKGLSHLRKAQSELQSQLGDIKSEVASHVKVVTESVNESPKPTQVRQTLPKQDQVFATPINKPEIDSAIDEPIVEPADEKKG